MKFIVDAHLPKKLAEFLTKQGFDSVHTLDLPEGNASSDSYINQVASKENRIVITKDSDFVDSRLRKGEPRRLVLVSTGDRSNKDLLAIVTKSLDDIVKLFESHQFVEISKGHINIHGE